nr:hypothetical protein [Pseudomonas caspiana]
MSYAHQGPAHVTVSARHFGSDPVDTLNEAVTITLAGSGTPDMARLEFAQALIGPDGANYVRVVLPNGLAVGGAIVQGDRSAHGGGWLTFQVEEYDLGLSV